MQDREFRCCLPYWLGVPLHSSPNPCPVCHSPADEFGDVLFSAAQSAALGPTREASNVVPDSMSRPADILLPTWHDGRPAALDDIISPLQQSTIQAAFTPGHALLVGTQRKLTAHLQACRSVGVTFIPETLGGLGEDSINTIRAISQRVNSPYSSSSTDRFSGEATRVCGYTGNMHPPPLGGWHHLIIILTFIFYHMLYHMLLTCVLFLHTCVLLLYKVI